MLFFYSKDSIDIIIIMIIMEWEQSCRRSDADIFAYNSM